LQCNPIDKYALGKLYAGSIRLKLGIDAVPHPLVNLRVLSPGEGAQLASMPHVLAIVALITSQSKSHTKVAIHGVLTLCRSFYK